MERVKKGFTIVELAIVLVVIGIILSMAVKGKSLVDAARLRMEVNKVRKLEAAIHIFLAVHPELIPSVNRTSYGYDYHWGNLDMQNLYDAGIVSKNELESKISSTPTVWTPIQCQYYSAKHGPDPVNHGLIDFFRGTSQAIDWAPTNYCARMLMSVTVNDVSSNMRWLPMPSRLRCAIEVYLDDENTRTGVARQVWSWKFTEFTKEEYSDCMKLPMETDSWGDMGVVLY